MQEKEKGMRKLDPKKQKKDKIVYDKIYAYAQTMGVGEVKKKLEDDGISITRATIYKYLENGDSRRGWPPIYERIRNVNQQAARVEDYNVANFRADVIKMCRVLYAQLAQRIRRFEQGDYDKLSVKDLVDCFEKLTRAMGTFGFDMKEILPEAEASKFSDWTTDEIYSLIYKGIVPERYDGKEVN